jgi:oligoribonuclease NrnB/cAMP/cGMP phosphodiesterase (DHH superfamily)
MEHLRSYLPPDEVDCVVYHNPCSDGFGGAYVFWKYLKETYNIDDPSENNRIRFIPFSHMMSEKDVRERVLPEVKGRNVVYIDVCPGPNVFLDMLIEPERAIVLDHHESGLKTTEKHPSDFVFKHCHIDQTYSGCILAHRYCYPDKEPPLFLKFIQDRDIWAWKLEEFSRPFTEAFHRSVPFEFAEYAKFEDEDHVYSLVKEGNVLSKYKDLRVLELAKRAKEGEITIDGRKYTVFIINTGEHISDLGHVLSQMDCPRFEKKCDFAMMWYYDEIRGKIKVSLRSDNDLPKEDQINVSTIARHFGGGGHPNAGGFTLDKSDLLLNALNEVADKPIEIRSPPRPMRMRMYNNKWFKFGFGTVAGAGLVGLGYLLGTHKG